MSKFDYKDYIKKNKFMIGNLKRYQTRTLLSENLLTEGTRSHIGYIDKNGNITSTYVHWDGYPDGVGKTAKKYYSGGKVKKLLKVDRGNGISALYPKFDGGPNHTFENPEDGQTIFYGRDRGEKNNMIEKGNASKLEKYLQSVAQTGAEYAYLYDENGNNWVYADLKKNKKEVFPL